MKIPYTSLLLSALLTSSMAHAELVKTYFKTGELKAQTHYINGTNTKIKKGIKNGIEKVYYVQGTLAYEVNYIHNKRDGKLLWYDKKGHKIAQINYNNGKLEGEEIAYFVNAKIKHKVKYVNDRKEGLQKEYYDNGQLALIVPYFHNKKEGMQKGYTYAGKLYSEVMYKNNYKEGLQKWYDKDGNVVKTELFKMDRPVNVMKQIEEKKEEPNILINNMDFSPKKVK